VFPEFERYAQAENLLNRKLTGILDAKIPRILGQGKTKAVGLDLPPAPIERKQEYLSLELPKEFDVPDAVNQEKLRIREELEAELKQKCSEEGARSLASQVLMQVQVEHQGLKNNYFYAGRLLLIPDKKRLSWSWSITPFYPIIDKIPPDIDYLVRAYTAAESKIQQLVIHPSEFEKQLDLSWSMARHFSESSDKILLSDVARMFVIAAQSNKFWGSPQKRFFTDVPEASFIANLVNYKNLYQSDRPPLFEFMPATLNDSFRKNVYHMPIDKEGTQTRPYVYIIKRQ